jgi:4-hydroxybenzoate polyprenyltransferase
MIPHIRNRPGPRARATALRASGRFATMGATLLGIGLIASSSFSYVAFVFLSLVPMAAAAVLEKRGNRSATICIGALTLATVLPIVVGAIAEGGSRSLITSMTAWTYVAAAVFGGVAIYFVLPTMSIFMDDMRATARVRELRKRQEILERDWGPEVRSTIAT